MSGQDSKGGKFAYYVCQSLMKQGSGACDCPRLNARRFEEMVVGKIRENVLTQSSIRELVMLAEEEMDGIAREQRQRLEGVYPPSQLSFKLQLRPLHPRAFRWIDLEDWLKGVVNGHVAKIRKFNTTGLSTGCVVGEGERDHPGEWECIWTTGRSCPGLHPGRNPLCPAVQGYTTVGSLLQPP